MAQTIDVSDVFDEDVIKNILLSVKKAEDAIRNMDLTSGEEKYESYLAVKKKLDSQDFDSFEAFEKAKTTLASLENDQRLQFYIQWVNSKEDKDREYWENAADFANKFNAVVIPMLQSTVQFSLAAAGKLDDLQASFSILLGNEQGAKSLVNTLSQLGTITPFRLETLAESSKNLIQFGIDARDVKDILMTLGDISAGSSVSLQELSGIYGRIAAEGKVEMGDLNEMIRSGIPIIDSLSAVLGVTVDEIGTMASEGKISFQDLHHAFQQMTSEGGTFYLGMDTINETLTGKTSALDKNLQALGADFGELLLPAIKLVLDTVNGLVSGFNGLDSDTKAVIFTIGGVVAISATAIMVFAALKGAIDAATTSQLINNAAALANPYVALAVAITAVTAGLAVWIARQHDVNAKMKKTQELSEKATTAFEKYRKAFSDLNTTTAEEGSSERYIALSNMLKAEEEFKKTQEQVFKDIKKNREDFNKIKGKNFEDKKNQENLLTSLQGTYYQALRPSVELAKDMLNAKMSEEEVTQKLTELTQLSIPYHEEILQLAKDEIIAAEKKANQRQEEGKANEELGEEITGKKPEEKKNTVDRYEKLKEAHGEYLEYLEKSESNLLTDKQKDDFENKLKGLKSDYDEFEAYLNRKKPSLNILNQYISEMESLQSENFTSYEEWEKKKNAVEKKYNEYNLKDFVEYLEKKKERGVAITSQEIEAIERLRVLSQEKQPDIEALQKYADMKIQIESHNFSSYEEWQEKKAETDKFFNDMKLQDYISYLEARLKAGKEMTEQEIDLLFELRDKNIESNDSVAELKKASFSTTITQIGGVLNEVATSIQNSFKSAEGEAESKIKGIAEIIGSLGSVLLQSLNSITPKIEAFEEALNNLEESKDKLNVTKAAVAMVAQAIGVSFQAMGSVANAVFAKIISDTEELQQAMISDKYESAVDTANKKYESEKKALEEWLTEKQNLLSFGYATEMELAQANYNEALSALESFQDEEGDQRKARLEEYKEALADRNEGDIQAAIEAKERELSAISEKKKRDLQSVVDEKKKELDKQKIAEDGAEKAKEIEYQKDLAMYNAEKTRIEETYRNEVELFNLKKANDIVNIAVSMATGVASAWASSMPLGPAGPAVASVLTGLLMGVSAAQIGVIAAKQPAPMPKLPEPPEKYMTGGVIPGFDNQDRTLLFASSGERVLTQRQNEAFEQMVDAMENRDFGGGGQQIVVHVYVDSSEIDVKRQIVEINHNEQWGNRRWR